MMEGMEIGSDDAPVGKMIDQKFSSAATTIGSFGGEMSEEGDEWFDRPDHPLMNKVIMDIVFKQLRRNELKECREVCKTWNVLTIPFTREEFVVTIYANINPERKLHTIENFVKVFRLNNLGIPFARFQLGYIGSIIDGHHQEFLQLCGNTTKYIKILKDKFTVEDMSELLKSTPKLETLEIPGRLHAWSRFKVKLFPDDSKPKLSSFKDLKVFYDNQEEPTDCPTFLEELITASENICCVHIYDYRPPFQGNYNFSSLEVLSLLEKLGREPILQEIVISIRKADDSSYVEILRKMAAKRSGLLKLKKLQYDAWVSESDQNRQSILHIIPYFKDTLEFLRIHENRFISFMEFPKMGCLTHLFVCLCHGFNSKFVNFNKIFPVLETLHLSQNMAGEYDEFFPESDPCPTIQSLRLYGFSFKINGFNQMLTVSPNLTKFQVEIEADGDEILRQIWTQMTQLESLHISGDDIQMKDSLDCVFTGISDHVLHEIKEVVNNLEELTTEVERRETILDLMNLHSQLPSIGNLTKLRSLTLEVIGDEDETYLTDLTGYLGFYSIKNLKNLNVHDCELTKSCCEILTKDMGLQFWTFKTPMCEDILSGSI